MYINNKIWWILKIKRLIYFLNILYANLRTILTKGFIIIHGFPDRISV